MKIRPKVRWRRGIFLLSILFLALVATMFISGAIAIAPSSLGRSRSQAQQATAQRAAQTGMQYALMRLRADINWNAAGPNKVTIDTTGLTVVEEQGNVVGTITDADGTVSQFRFRFNWQDGSALPGGDNLINPGPAMVIDFPYVSVNNVPGGSDTTAPQVNNSDGSITGNPAKRFVVPAHTCLLAVEGRCSTGLTVATTAAPNPTSFGAAVTSVAVESLYQMTSLGQPVVDAAAMAVGNITGNFDNHQTLQLQASQNETARIRTKSTINVTNTGDATSIQGSGAQLYDSAISSGTILGSGVTNKGGDKGGFYALPWSSVHQASSTNQLPAGTYVARSTGIFYYNMGLSDYTSFIQNNPLSPGTPVTSSFLPSSVTVSGGNKLTVTADTLVSSAASNTKEFNFIPDRGVDQGPGALPAPLSSSQISTGLFGSNGLFGSPAGTTYSMNSQNYLDQVGSSYNSRYPGGGPYGTYTAGVGFSVGGQTVPVSGPLTALTTTAQQALAGIFQDFLQHGNQSDYNNFKNQRTDSSANFPTSYPPGGLIPGVTSSVVPQDIELNFNPPSGGTAILTVPGNLTVGAKLTGQGGSLTVNGAITLEGLGVDLSATPNAKDGVSMYSTQNIGIDTWDGKSKYFDVSLKGVVYALGNITALMADSTTNPSHWGQFQLTGTLVADTSAGGGIGGGTITLNSKQAQLQFDPSYLVGLMQTPPSNPSFNILWMDQH